MFKYKIVIFLEHLINLIPRKCFFQFITYNKLKILFKGKPP